MKTPLRPTLPLDPTSPKLDGHGQPTAKNPVALIIPCHRVLAAGGKIGGFSAPGGAETKAKMLALEGVRREPEQRALGL